jgi:transcriptional regulator with PAS, ATPase and Fis domain
MQTKFMRVLQSGEIRPLGSNHARQIDVRIISASSQPLEKLIEKQQFREDLYYRLHVYSICVPPLRERQEDIPVLAHHFLRKFAQQQQKQAESFHENLLDYLKHHLWDGNIRQLENFVERLVTMAPAEMKRLDEAILPSEIKKEMKRDKNLVENADPHKSLPERVAEYEAQLIRRALEATSWSQSQAARQLRIPVQTLHYKMKKLGIERA